MVQIMNCYKISKTKARRNASALIKGYCTQPSCMVNVNGT